MQTIVLDNSVISKAVFNEDESEKVLQILNLKDNIQLSVFVPEIFRYEFFNAVSRKKGAKAAEKAYENIMGKQCSIIYFENDLIESANRLMEKYPQISFYDAAYHALAKAYNALFVTADKKYYALTKKEGNIALLSKLKVKKLAK
jgi:predicted nucleic acid-binding protein